MNNTKILIIEDEQAIVSMLEMVLRKEGFTHIMSASTCEEGLTLMERDAAEIVLLDVMLPDGTGFDLCPKIRALGEPHIIFLTARSSDLDVLTGFAIGGDDYVTKPFNPLEIAARIKARLRRPGFTPFSASASVVSRYAYDRFVVDETAGELVVDGEPVGCPAQVFQLLLFFCKNPGIVFSKAQLYEAVWGMDGLGDDNTVMVHIRRIRERIERDPSQPEYLLTVRGLGYKLIKPRGTV
ncbi:DNA-binding response regulator [Paenibacillus sp. CAA11]|uniref:response regulator transcription factor n=1 Tax=Paenibacillus sp. CAA11 TaxID=1532905 RepID=UPI000D33660E|nr:response regulator transcription factor [Paenibacillus sp. CAA11]AWB44326.1 DNA-binding response regulator [Paenibacillus sp. CAA11]